MTRETTKALPGVLRRNLYLAPAFVSFLLLDGVFRYFYRFLGATDVLAATPCLFTLGWSLVLCALLLALPRVGKRIFMAVIFVLNTVLILVHGVMANMFGHVFSFADLGFADDGFAFLSADYIVLRKALLAALALCLVLMALAFVLVPRERGKKRRLWVALCLAALGVGGIFGAKATIPQEVQTMAWDDSYDIHADYAVYENFNDPNRAIMLCGLYQYTFRDLYRSLGIADWLKDEQNEEQYEQIDAYVAQKQTGDNEMTGLFAGKNLILIQLEAIDSWMLTEEYMPNLWAIKQGSLDFTQHFSSVFIAGGTFNTEFTANTGLIPATGTVSQKVYTQNSYPYSLANLFRAQGYSANSFHGSEGDVYSREQVHLNLGYEAYHSGTDMGMANYQMDTQLMCGYEDMVSDDPYFTFIITFSGHGPYNDESEITTSHIDQAKAAVEAYMPYEGLTDEDLQSYQWAVAHAMETDAFVGQLFAALEEEGRLEDTVVAFYADHYNYYYGNDAQIVAFKGVEDTTMAQWTPFFIYSQDTPAQQITKVTSSIDILPTLANLFDLDVDLSLFVGNDAFSAGGGYAPFRGYAWYDGEIYYSANYTGEMTEYIAQRSAQVVQEVDLCNAILACDYYRYVSEAQRE